MDFNFSDYVVFGFFLGYVFNMFSDVLLSISNYYFSKSYLLQDYEKLINENMIIKDVLKTEYIRTYNIALTNYKKRNKRKSFFKKQ